MTLSLRSAACSALSRMADALRNSTVLEQLLRELAILSTLITLRSRYEFLRHWQVAQDVGVSEEKLVGLPRAQEDPERSVIQFST
jgi:alkylhydroperoxidase family enzyme